MKHILLTSVIFLFLTAGTRAQDTSLFENHHYIQNGDTLPYRLLLPLNYDETKSYPLVLFLHGAGERGSDNEKQLTHGSSLFLADSNRQKFPAIVVFPQCPQNSFWSNLSSSTDSATGKRMMAFPVDGPPTRAMSLLLGLVQEINKNYKPDQQRLYVGGLSMGGMGTFEIVRRLPNTFAAAFAICGGANPATAPQLKSTSWWIFHGLKDPVVDPEFSRIMAAALLRANAEVRLTTYPEDGHNSWDSAFKEPDFLSWIFNHRKTKM